MNAQKGYVGLTDPDWYSFLSDRPRVDEVNFWQPHGGRAFRAIAPGDPFFFKLRAGFYPVFTDGWVKSLKASSCASSRRCMRGL